MGVFAPESPLGLACVFACMVLTKVYVSTVETKENDGFYVSALHIHSTQLSKLRVQLNCDDSIKKDGQKSRHYLRNELNNLRHSVCFNFNEKISRN